MDADYMVVDELDDQATTIKTKCISPDDELKNAQEIYDNALREMLENPNELAYVEAFTQANNTLYSIQDKYRLGAKLLLEFKQTHPIGSRQLHGV